MIWLADIRDIFCDWHCNNMNNYYQNCVSSAIAVKGEQCTSFRDITLRAPPTIANLRMRSNPINIILCIIRIIFAWNKYCIINNISQLHISHEINIACASVG